jgi:hypothetical protein
MIPSLSNHFPRFAALHEERQPEGVLAPALESKIREIEELIGLPLPDSYKAFLRCTRGFWLMGGVIQFSAQHPFIHDAHFTHAGHRFRVMSVACFTACRSVSEAGR